MLPRKLLIPLRKESVIWRTGRWVDAPSFKLLVSSRPAPLAASRYAFIVSKKNFSLSTARHRIKRRLADAVGSLLDHIPKGLDIVIFAKKETGKKTVEKLRDELETQIKNL